MWQCSGFIGAGVSFTLRCRDRLADPFDLRRCGLEERTDVIDLTKPRDGARTLRSLITAGRTPLTIYTALIDAPGEAITAITDAMQRAGMTADIINDVTDNDTLLSCGIRLAGKSRDVGRTLSVRRSARSRTLRRTAHLPTPTALRCSSS